MIQKNCFTKRWINFELAEDVVKSKLINSKNSTQHDQTFQEQFFFSNCQTCLKMLEVVDKSRKSKTLTVLVRFS